MDKLINEKNPNYQIALSELLLEEIPFDKFYRIAGDLFYFHDHPSFELMEVPLDQIRPLTRHVYQPRLDKAARFMEMYTKFQIPLFKPARCFNTVSKIQIVSPPIVEVHNNHYVLCDGTHRVYQARKAGLKTIIVLAVKGTIIPLPGDVNDWQDVRELKEEVSVAENFINFKKEFLTGYTWIFNGEKCWMTKDDYDRV